MAQLYPLRFRPLLRRYVWGGRRLATLLGKDIGDESCAESWEVCDRPDDQNVVAAGPLAGLTLHAVVERYGRELLGREQLGRDGGAARFPLLLKFLDAKETLSVQVHPDDARGARLQPPEVGKNEAWFVLDAAPGSVIYAGLKPGVDADSLRQAIEHGTCADCLQIIVPRAGDCYYLPAGTVHALGGGLLVAEIQQPSDVTYRLFDWNRRDARGQSRPLHVAQALECIRWDSKPTGAASPLSSNTPTRQRLVECESFVWERWRLTEPTPIGGDDRAHVLAVVSGTVRLAGEPTGELLERGDTALLPAACGATLVTPSPDAVVLDAYVAAP